MKLSNTTVEQFEDVVFFGVDHPPEMDVKMALQIAKDILRNTGYEIGEVDYYEIVRPGAIIANIEVGASLTSDLMRRGSLEFSNGGVKVAAEWP